MNEQGQALEHECDALCPGEPAGGVEHGEFGGSKAMLLSLVLPELELLGGAGEVAVGFPQHSIQVGQLVMNARDI